ncbi:hypothetical protein P6F26_12615 [Roseibacterium sp. SDUM158017]|uniref:hypothetical protein n=1 Tax=Roseicyclus salinarum TaxID=3036773 RepID=UPI0024154986|nr:hypothetical protein [Roseibacterium sp. SDUM158017]MDG4649290.1 hypothetical protein [Roseibacterium sp. SDUM158017]
MSLQNRVLPTGEIVADPARGTLMGNRGILHDADRRLGTPRWRHKAWICCVLSFKERKRRPMSPGRYTELFFLDEAVALAAGHRPCAECRRAGFEAFRTAWRGATGQAARAADIDAALHPARVTRRRAQVRHEAEAAALPDGAFVLMPDGPCLVAGDCLLPHAPNGYGPARARPTGRVTVLTPAPVVAALAAGYRPELHPSAAAR